jgi:hypothetical protein
MSEHDMVNLFKIISAFVLIVGSGFLGMFFDEYCGIGESAFYWFLGVIFTIAGMLIIGSIK